MGADIVERDATERRCWLAELEKSYPSSKVQVVNLNLAKATLQSTHTDAEPLSFAIASLKRLALNEHLFDLLIDMFDLEPSLIKSHPNYSELLSYGSLTP